MQTESFGRGVHAGGRRVRARFARSRLPCALSRSACGTPSTLCSPQLTLCARPAHAAPTQRALRPTSARWPPRARCARPARDAPDPAHAAPDPARACADPAHAAHEPLTLPGPASSSARPRLFGRPPAPGASLLPACRIHAASRAPEPMTPPIYLFVYGPSARHAPASVAVYVDGHLPREGASPGGCTTSGITPAHRRHGAGIRRFTASFSSFPARRPCAGSTGTRGMIPPIPRTACLCERNATSRR